MALTAAKAEAAGMDTFGAGDAWHWSTGFLSYWETLRQPDDAVPLMAMAEYTRVASTVF